jgi:hypothetical protein
MHLKHAAPQTRCTTYGNGTHAATATPRSRKVETPMARTRYIKGKDGKFTGSIGSGKTHVPTAAPHTIQRSLTNQTTNATDNPWAPEVAGEYNPQTEAANISRALRTPRGILDRLRRSRERRNLESKFGAIDWTDTSDLAAPHDPFAPSAAEPNASSTPPAQTAPVTEPRYDGIAPERARLMDGKTFNSVHVRVTDSGDRQFQFYGNNIRVLRQAPQLLTDPNLCEFNMKEHLLLVPADPRLAGSPRSRRVGIDALSFNEWGDTPQQ